MKIVGLIVLALAVLFVGYCTINAQSPEAQERMADRDKVWECEALYKRMQTDPRETRRSMAFIYDVCEKRKAEFRQKWGRNP